MAKAKVKAAGDKGGKTVRVVTETVEEREEPGGELELDEVPGDDEDEEDRDALSELDELAGSGARYEVRRTAPAPFTGYVGTYTRDIFTPDLLRQEWGGGNFTLRVKNSKGEYVGSRQIVLAGEAHHKREPIAPAAPAQGQDNGLAAVLASINASNEARAKAADAQTKLLTDLVIGLINKPAPVAPPAPDPIAIIASLKDILKPDKGDSGADAIKLLMQGISLGKDLGGGGDSENSMADVALKGFDTLKELAHLSPPAAPVARPAARRPGLPHAPPAGPAPGSVPAAEAAPAAPASAPNNAAHEVPEMSDTAKQIAWIKQQTVMLSRLAHAGKDPDLYAEVFLDNLPAFVTAEMIHEQMKKPDAVARLAFLNSDVKKYAAWFEEFRTAVVELIEAPEDDAPETGEETGEDQLDVGMVDSGGDVINPMPGSDENS